MMVATDCQSAMLTLARKHADLHEYHYDAEDEDNVVEEEDEDEYVTTGLALLIMMKDEAEDVVLSFHIFD